MNDDDFLKSKASSVPCCGCPISYKAIDDLELIRPYEPNVVKAAWNIFGQSYEYRQLYNAYKNRRKQEERGKNGN